MKRRHIIAILVLLLSAIPVSAVFNEKNLGQTLSVLRYELSEQNKWMETIREKLKNDNEKQHREMIGMIKKCNELALILYSQDQDYTFDLTYALKEVTDKYDEFSKKRSPYDEVVTRLNSEVDRYERLIESLRRLPPALDTIPEIPDSLSLDENGEVIGLKYRKMKGKKVEVTIELHNTPLDTVSVTDTSQEQEQGLLASIFSAQPNGEEETEEEETGRTPFLLDSEGMEDRDSCLAYALNLLHIYKESREKIIKDNEHYASLNDRISDSYRYAQDKYKLLQKHIFIDGQEKYISVLKRFPEYCRVAIADAKSKYGNIKIHTPHDGNEDEMGHGHHHERSEWRGPIVSAFFLVILVYLSLSVLLSVIFIKIFNRIAGRAESFDYKNRKPCIAMIFGVIIFGASIMVADHFVSNNFIIMASKLLKVFTWLLAAILTSILIRVKPENTAKAMHVYLPVTLLGLIVITFRIIFIPNTLTNLILPPLFLIFTVWQILTGRKYKKATDRADRVFSVLSMTVLAACTAISMYGYVFMSIQIFIWWLFQVAAIATVTAVSVLLDKYEKTFVKKSMVRYKESHKGVSDKNPGAFIEVTWFYDFLRMAVMPILGIITIPVSLLLASDVFDLTEIVKIVFYKPFFNISDADGNPILHLSLYKIVLVSGLFFIFRYVSYAAKAFYRQLSLQKHMRVSGKDFVRSNEINLTLANNVISILTWGIYLIIAITLLKIPMGAISIVAAGLATGIGLALKDVLNNFIYGIQLMAGRLRVGDYIECDGVRGKVESITYQSTQVLTLDGAIMSFTNTTLFNKNFKNLTKNNAYECVKIPVGVQYGADVEQVREMLCAAMKSLDTVDKYGRHIIDQKRGITVAFSDFGNSSVDLTVKQFVLVEEEPAFIAKAKEIIYNTLNENGIEIPFPQRDVYIRRIEKGDEIPDK